MPPTEDTVPSTRGRSVSALTLESQQRGSRMLIFDKGCAIPSIYKFFYPESTGRSNVKCVVWVDNSLSETSDVIESAASAEEAEFFAKAFDIILQQKQKNVVVEKMF